MVNAPAQLGSYPQGREALFPGPAKIRRTDFTAVRDVWREAVTIIKAFKLPHTRSGFSLLLTNRSEVCVAKTSEPWRMRARMNPTWPLIFAIIFFFVLLSLRAAEIQ
jgi:hypothetical protein